MTDGSGQTMNTDMQSSAELDKLLTALAKAQGRVEGAKKDATNPAFRSKYATLASVWDACREALSSEGLSILHLPGSHGGAAGMWTMLGHSSGQWLRGWSPLRPTKDDPQGMGSAITYARRYWVAALGAICPEDDDGNAASLAPDVSKELAGAVKALDAGDALALWSLTRMDSYRDVFGKLNTKQKAKARELEQAGAEAIGGIAVKLEEAASRDDTHAVAEIVGELDAIQKRAVWAQLSPETQHYIKAQKEAA